MWSVVKSNTIQTHTIKNCVKCLFVLVWRHFSPILTTLFKHSRKLWRVRNFVSEKSSYIFVFGVVLWDEVFKIKRTQSHTFPSSQNFHKKKNLKPRFYWDEKYNVILYFLQNHIVIRITSFPFSLLFYFPSCNLVPTFNCHNHQLWWKIFRKRILNFNFFLSSLIS